MSKTNMLFTIVIFLIILSILVIAHEIGHFAAAKYFGVQVEEFGLGFPPRAAQIHQSKDGVKWTLNWLPLGGFVKLKGEDGQSKQDPDSFSHKKPWKRIVILSAGVFMNVVLAFVLLSIGFSVGWPQDLTEKSVPDKFIKEKNIMIAYIEPASPADKADIKTGDIIKNIDNQPFAGLADMQNFIKDKENQKVSIEIDRTGEIFKKEITPQKIEFNIDSDGKKTIEKIGIGVGLAEVGVVRYPVHQAVYLGAKNTVIYMARIFQAFYNLIKDLILTRKISPNIGGPVMIAALSGRAAQLGFIYIIQFIALLSLNLAIINILPLPALDGGRILFAIVEKFKGRAVSVNLESWIHMIGFWLIILLMILVTARDIARFQIWDKVKNIIAS
ncbi:MAG: RIP metalloprotease RseP [Candidatus Jacksonbacteria bacterium]